MEFLKNKHILFICLLLTLLFYGHFVLFSTIGIDTEVAILDYSYLLTSWGSIGRIGLVFLKTIFFPLGYSQLVSNISMLVSLGIFLWLVYKLGKVSPVIFSVIFLSLPITYFQLYFQLQNFEVMIGTIIVLVSAYYYVHSRNIGICLLALFAMGFSVSIYQSLLDFIVAAVSFFLIQNFENSHFSKESIIKFFVAPIFSVMTYWALNQFLNPYERSDYLQIFFLSRISLLSIAVILIIVGFHLYLIHKKKVNIIYCLCSTGLYSSPFLTLALVGHLQYRALFPSLPFVIGIVFSTIFKTNLRLRNMTYLSLILTTLPTLYLTFQNYLQYQDDVRLAQTIKEKIPNSDYRVQFVGKYQNNRIPFIIAGEPAGKSFFSWDPLPNQQRSDNFLRLNGANFISSSLEENSIAADNQQLSPYPNPEWIKIDKENKIVYVAFE